MILHIKKNTIIWGNKVVTLEELFTEEFYEQSNRICDDYYINSYLVNELFLYIIQPYLAVYKYVSTIKPERVYFCSPDKQLDCYFSDVCEKLNIAIEGERRKFCPSRLFGKIKIIASYIYINYILFKIPVENKDIHWSEFTVTRDKASLSKMKNFDFHKEKEDPWSDDSVYRYFRKSQRMKWAWKSLWASYAEMNKTYRFLIDKTGKKTASLLYERYSKRIVHTFLYANLFDELFKINAGSTYYTGLNLERFAVVEDFLAQKHHLKTICIPHGLEYGYKFPLGFTTQLFYTTSKNAAAHLNAMYNTEKFVFDATVAEKMFRTKTKMQNMQKRVVYFTEPREPFVNTEILRSILPLCENDGITLCIKHHPGDNLNDYKEFDNRLTVIDNLDDALSNNICFARKSTTLIEALYNGSKVAAIITNNKDNSIFKTFPSLQDSNINVFYSINSLFEWISAEIKQ